MPARTRGLIVGILLAAGAGSRFGGGKLLARLADDRGVAETACARLLPAVDRVVAVVPAQPARSRTRCVRRAPRWCAATRRRLAWASASPAAYPPAPTPQAGWSRSATCPWCPPPSTAWSPTLRAGADIAAPVCQGRRGHPVGFAARFGDELRALDGDEGARAVLARHREALLELVVDDDAGWQDIDTPSDLAAVNRRLGRP